MHTLLFAGPVYRVLSRDQGPGGCRRRLPGGVVGSFNQRLPSEQLMPAVEKEDPTLVLRGCGALLQRLAVSVPTLHSRRQMALLGSSASVTGG